MKFIIEMQTRKFVFKIGSKTLQQAYWPSFFFVSFDQVFGPLGGLFIFD